GTAGQGAVQGVLESLEALVVEPGVADDLRCNRALRVEAELLRVEADAGEAERLQVVGLVGVRLPRDVHEAMRPVYEARVEARRIEPELLRCGEGQVASPSHLAWIRVDGGRGLSDREGLAGPVDGRCPPRRAH